MDTIDNLDTALTHVGFASKAVTLAMDEVKAIVKSHSLGGQYVALADVEHVLLKVERDLLAEWRRSKRGDKPEVKA